MEWSWEMDDIPADSASIIDGGSLVFFRLVLKIVIAFSSLIILELWTGQQYKWNCVSGFGT